MRMLDRKLLRDLRRMWAQALAIALVHGVGRRHARAGERRLPLARRDARRLLPALPVRRRVRRGAAGAQVASPSRSTTIPASPPPSRASPSWHCSTSRACAEPATGLAVSVPDLARAAPQPAASARGPAAGARAHRRGRRSTRPSPRRMACAWARPSRRSSTASKRELKVVGIALSPEFIYALGPGDLMPDDRRFAVLWMSEKALAGAVRPRRRLQCRHA